MHKTLTTSQHFGSLCSLCSQQLQTRRHNTNFALHRDVMLLWEVWPALTTLWKKLYDCPYAKSWYTLSKIGWLRQNVTIVGWTTVLDCTIKKIRGRVLREKIAKDKIAMVSEVEDDHLIMWQLLQSTSTNQPTNQPTNRKSPENNSSKPSPLAKLAYQLGLYYWTMGTESTFSFFSSSQCWCMLTNGVAACYSVSTQSTVCTHQTWCHIKVYDLNIAHCFILSSFGFQGSP